MYHDKKNIVTACIFDVNNLNKLLKGFYKIVIKIRKNDLKHIGTTQLFILFVST